MFLSPCDQKQELKQNAERYVVCEGSPVEVQWAVRWVGEDLWWEGFVEQLCIEWIRGKSVIIQCYTLRT